MSVEPTPTPATEARSVRAATTPLATARLADELYLVDNGKQGDDHAQYTVDLREPACTCPDYQYRADSDPRVAKRGCLHIRRVRMEQGEMDIAPLREAGVPLDQLLITALEGER